MEKTKFLTVKGFKEQVKEKLDTSNTIITKDYEILNSDTGSTFIITNDSMDRDNDIVDANGLDISNYLKNPVVLWGHDSSELPIGKCVNIEQVDNGWQATVEFAPSDYPYNGAKAESIRRSIKDGFLNAVSIGFIPLEWDFNEEGGLNITKAELTEFSIVSIPSNRDALVITRSLDDEQETNDEAETEEDEEIEEDQEQEQLELEEEIEEEQELKEKEKQKAIRKKRILFDLDYFGIKC
ncbi:HK97 family phage prohead protease [Novacetimonas hansenii]|uniref:Prohead serine protease domain-containing protein n=1 Tax=Novacetimonas hansenii TaxID=436 RepID=A0ABQ0SIJ4_NOVHA|nr:HK97 family phage prohead protease [Novacetimonas hansenii]GAN84045.1 peptidase U35 [Novacetimonas hansenii JCM 7643]GBQ55864.1 hypothetical protein AA0243_1033 [Novacetimonas hansenii NRIC 0243]GEC64625.1 hypothetical protein GHA01_24740 [Novacetimonas hansenii]